MANFNRKLAPEQAAIAQDHCQRRRSIPTANAMAIRWNVSRGAVWNAINGDVRCRALTEEEQAEARANHARRLETKTIAQLAREWGVSASTVSNDVIATRRSDRKARRALGLIGRGQEGAQA